MKSRFLTITGVLVCLFLTTNAQITAFSENFDGVTSSMTSMGTPGFATSNGFFNSAPKSSIGQYSTAGEITLTSPSFSTSGNNFVILSFSHICKISFFDSCLVECSVDNGFTWTTITPANSNYGGTSTIYQSLGYFNSGAYSLWDFANGGTISNTWWQQESFDISALVGNQNNVKIRFRAKDDASANGMQGYIGWFIDDVSVIKSTCEPFPPAGQVVGLFPNGITFGTGPFTINATIVDLNSGVDSNAVNLHYEIKNGGVTNIYSVPMTFTFGDIYNGQYTGVIPVLTEGDTLCYYITANDYCGNEDSIPVVCAYLSSGVSIPYVDGFDSGNAGWSDTTISGSSWQLGTPAFGLTTGALSNPNAWDVDLLTAYVNNTECILYSPVFDFSNITSSTLSFSHNYFTEDMWDGVRLETSTNQGLIWQVLGIVADPLATNWYTDSNLNSSSLPAWEGTSGGWINSTYKMNSFAGISDVRLRFVFTSDGAIVKDGYSIDNFSILIPADYDLEATSILPPGTAPAGTPQIAYFTVSNVGLLDVNTFQVQLLLNGVPVDTAYSTTTLSAGTSILLNGNFICPGGVYTLCAVVLLPADTNLTNNTVCTTSIGIQVLSLPYFNDFETSGNDWEVSSNSTFTRWEFGTPLYGATSGAYSGVNCWDVNLNGTYSDNSTALVYSPYFTLGGTTNPVRVSFLNNFKTPAGIDGAHLEFELDQSGIWTTAGVYNDVNGYNWYNDSVASFPVQYQFAGNSAGWKRTYLNLPVSGVLIRFRLVFKSGTGGIQGDGYSFDDFAVTSIPNNDLGVTSLSNFTGTAGSSQSPVVTIHNFGAASQSGFNVYYTVNGILQGSVPYTSSIFPGQMAVVNMPSFIVPSGAFDMCAYTGLLSDTDHSNDTLCVNTVGVSTVALPYFDDFEGVQQWSVVTSGDPLTNWELGMPNFGATTGTYSGTKCWDVNLITAYGPNALTALVSPYFDFTNVAYDTLSFWHQYNNENVWDGVRLEYDLNASGNWQVLGYLNDPAAINWYNSAALNSSGLPGWTDVSTGWVQSRYDLSALGSPGIVQFRFIFTSDGSVVDDGHSIDDFRISNALPDDITVSSVNTPGLNTTAGVSVNLNVKVFNTGLNPSTSFNIYYSLNGGPVVMNSFASSISAFNNVNINLGNILPVSGQNILKIYTDMATDQNRTNDTLNYIFNAVNAFVIPFSDNFEVQNNDWTSIPSTSGNTQWQWGLPAWGSTSSAHGGVACWDINLNIPYGNTASARLISPIFNYTNITQSNLSFWANYNMEYGADGCQLTFTTDDVNWAVLGTFNDPNAANWYDLGNVSGFGGQPAWSGSSLGWRQVTYNTSILEGYPFVRFGFLFRSDINLAGDGISIDDFILSGTVGINENLSKNSIVLFPNPANDVLYIKSPVDLGAPQIIIYNISGQHIPVVTDSFSNGITRLNISGLEAGVYMVRVEGEASGSYHKLIVR
jgi:Secretion system C-terminal sorting domain